MVNAIVSLFSNFEFNGQKILGYDEIYEINPFDGIVQIELVGVMKNVDSHS